MGGRVAVVVVVFALAFGSMAVALRGLHRTDDVAPIQLDGDVDMRESDDMAAIAVSEDGDEDEGGDTSRDGNTSGASLDSAGST
jgi:hypothetical protein